MTLVEDVIDTWKAYLAALEEDNKAAIAEERHELLYDIRNFLFANGALSAKALDALVKARIPVERLSAAAVAVTLDDGEVVEITEDQRR